MILFRTHPRLIRWLAVSLLVSLVLVLLISWRTPDHLSDMMTAYNPRWSADGTYLMASCADSIDHTGATVYELCFAKPDLSGLIRIEEIPFSHHASGPVWAPAGTELAFGGDAGLILTTSSLTPSKRLTMDTGCYAPAWSPDGYYIACASRARQILIVERATGQITQLTTIGDNYAPQWVRNGQAIIFERTMSDEPSLLDISVDIYLVNLATHTEERLIANIRPQQEVVVSADGSQVLYTNEEQTGFTVINLDTGASDNLLAPYQACLSSIQYPQWSSDTKYLAFTAQHFGPSSQQVYLLDMQTHELFQITQFTARDEGIVGGVAWSPDNTHIATAFDESQRYDAAQILMISLADTPFVSVDCTRNLPAPPCQRSPTSACSRPAGVRRFWYAEEIKAPS
jgi:Tol biopolymer transport system component